jgi:hypothetical protein
MQVVAIRTSASPAWRWRIVDYSGVIVEESRETFPSIAVAVARGNTLLAQMNTVDRPVQSVPAPPYHPSPTVRRRVRTPS